MQVFFSPIPCPADIKMKFGGVLSATGISVAGNGEWRGIAIGGSYELPGLSPNGEFLDFCISSAE